jgi:hypothetical protein
MFKLKLKKLTYATCDENLTRKFVETVYIRLLVEIFHIIHFLFIFYSILTQNCTAVSGIWLNFNFK